MTTPTAALGDLIRPAKVRRAGSGNFPILSMTMHDGLVDQATKFKKRVASTDTSQYKVVARKQLVVGFPIDEGVLSVQDLYPEAIVSPAYNVWDIEEGVDAAYLEKYLRSIPALEFYASKLRGTTARRRTLPTDVFLSLPVPLPSAYEQRRISDILDRADGLCAKRRESSALVNNLAESTFLDMFGDPATNPRGLPLVALGDLGFWSSGGTPSRSRADYFVGAIPWFSSGELGDLHVTDSAEHIGPLALKETSAKMVPVGSILLGMYDTAALKSSIASIGCSCNQAIAFARVDEQLADTYFVYYAVQVAKDHFRRLQRGIRQKNLNLSMIRDIRIPLPSLERQQEFAQRVLQIEEIKDASRSSAAETRSLAETLAHRAFGGQL